MGCVYFYLLTNGKHPFGENFHRQADNRLPADNILEETNLCDNEEIESTPCDKENLNPVIVEECEPKKKNKKRRKHQKKTRLESPGAEEDT